MIVPQVVAVDFDRTLANVDLGVQRLCHAAEPFGLDAYVRSAYANAIQDGGSFSPLAGIAERLTLEAFKALQERFVALDGPAIAYDDARPFLDMLSRHTIPYVILTYGVSVLWQQLKLAASGLPGSVHIMDHPNKGQAIAEWQTDEGFNVPTCEQPAASVCLIDDKPIAFAGLPSTCHGLLICRGDGRAPDAPAESADSITAQTIRSLRTIAVRGGRLHVHL